MLILDKAKFNFHTSSYYELLRRNAKAYSFILKLTEILIQMCLIDINRIIAFNENKEFEINIFKNFVIKKLRRYFFKKKCGIDYG